MKNLLAMGALSLLFPFGCLAQARTAVVAAETSFATQSWKDGTAAAFLANSASNGLLAEEGQLANAQDVWRTRPARVNTCLTWYPVLADAAQSGDLGYTTGPWTLLENDKPKLTGEYVTVWRKQLDGTWKFVVDMGIERIGTAPAKAAAVLAPRLPAAVATPSAAPSNFVLDVDRKFAEAEFLKPGATYEQYLSAEARLYRPGLSMMWGAAATANMKNLDGGYLFTPTGGYLAAAGDLGYAVGTLRRAATSRHPEESGSYLRIWRREEAAGWRVVLELFDLTLPPAATAVGSLLPEQDASGNVGKLPIKRVQ